MRVAKTKRCDGSDDDDDDVSICIQDKLIKCNSIDLRGQNSPSLSILFNFNFVSFLSSPFSLFLLYSLVAFVFLFSFSFSFFLPFFLSFSFLFLCSSIPFSLLASYSIFPSPPLTSSIFLFLFCCLSTFSLHYYHIFFYHHPSIPSTPTLPFSSLNFTSTSNLYFPTHPLSRFDSFLTSFLFPHQLLSILLSLPCPFHRASFSQAEQTFVAPS